MTKLIDTTTGVELHIGDIVKTFRDEDVRISQIRPHEGQSGRVYVTKLGAEHSLEREFFPSVINSRFITSEGELK